MMINHFKFTIFVLLFISIQFSFAFDPEEILKSPEIPQHLTEFLDFNPGHPTKRYPFGQWKKAGQHFQFGFESEYPISDSALILHLYRPEDRFGLSQNDWSKMSDHQRIDWVQKNVKLLFPETRKPGGLILIPTSKFKKFLPDRLIQDETGNLEIIVAKVFDTFESWMSNIGKLIDEIGPGSMQGTVSIGDKGFFPNAQGIDIDEYNFGFLNFHSELCVIEKLESGHHRYLLDPTKSVARSFEHPFLDPIRTSESTLLKNYLEHNHDGRYLSPARLNFISSNDASFKFNGSIVYRPDILGRKRIILEARDAHNKFTLLVDRMLRILFYFSDFRLIYSTKKIFTPFNPKASYIAMIADLEKDGPKVKEMLEEMIPAKMKPGIQYTEEEIEALKVYQNFSWPYRDWDMHIEHFSNRNHLNKEMLAAKIHLERSTYREVLISLADEFHRIKRKENPASTSIEKIRSKLHGALVTFSHNLELRKLFLDFEINSILETQTLEQYLQSMKLLANNKPEICTRVLDPKLLNNR